VGKGAGQPSRKWGREGARYKRKCNIGTEKKPRARFTRTCQGIIGRPHGGDQARPFRDGPWVESYTVKSVTGPLRTWRAVPRVV